MRGKHIRIVVMNNLLPRDVEMNWKYDLKGSTLKRTASSKERAKSSPTFKDLDFRTADVITRSTYQTLLHKFKKSSIDSYDIYNKKGTFSRGNYA